MTLEEQFDLRVSTFLRGSGLSPTALGRKALGDPALMGQIARGRSLSLRTVDRVLAFIDAHGGPDAAGNRRHARRTREGAGRRATGRRNRWRERRCDCCGCGR